MEIKEVNLEDLKLEELYERFYELNEVIPQKENELQYLKLEKKEDVVRKKKLELQIKRLQYLLKNYNGILSSQFKELENKNEKAKNIIFDLKEEKKELGENELEAFKAKYKKTLLYLKEIQTKLERLEKKVKEASDKKSKLIEKLEKVKIEYSSIKTPREDLKEELDKLIFDKNYVEYLIPIEEENGEKNELSDLCKMYKKYYELQCEKSNLEKEEEEFKEKRAADMFEEDSDEISEYSKEYDFSLSDDSCVEGNSLCTRIEVVKKEIREIAYKISVLKYEIEYGYYMKQDIFSETKSLSEKDSLALSDDTLTISSEEDSLVLSDDTDTTSILEEEKIQSQNEKKITDELDGGLVLVEKSDQQLEDPQKRFKELLEKYENGTVRKRSKTEPTPERKRNENRQVRSNSEPPREISSWVKWLKYTPFGSCVKSLMSAS